MVQKAKEVGIPSLYFTNLISARPLMGAAGAGSLAQVVNAAIANKDRMDRMKAFFEASATATPPASGRATPTSSRSSGRHHQKKLDKKALAAKAAEMI